MPEKKASEFRRYRRALFWIYLVVAGSGFGLLTASVFYELLVGKDVETHTEASFDPNAPDPTELLRCGQSVRELFVELGAKTSELLGRPPLQGARGELSTRWQTFSARWRRDWVETGARCGFGEFSGAPLGDAYERVAHVHESLPKVRLKYQNLLVRFEDEQAAELARMRTALDQSVATLEERAGGNR